MRSNEKYLKADELAELFRDMAEFAESDAVCTTLLLAARTVEELPGVCIPERVIKLLRDKERADRNGKENCFLGGVQEHDFGFRNAEGYHDPTAYLAIRNTNRGRK